RGLDRAARPGRAVPREKIVQRRGRARGRRVAAARDRRAREPAGAASRLRLAVRLARGDRVSGRAPRAPRGPPRTDRDRHRAAGHEVDASQQLAIAALASLPVLHLGFDWLSGWREVIVYPGEFRVRREHHDEHTGVVTEGEDDLIGEAWQRGPLILSWADVAADLANPFDGFNVVVHEVAHKLDMLDGEPDGTPRLPRGIALREWVATMQPA